MKKTHSTLVWLMLAVSAAHADESVLIPQLKAHPQSTDVGVTLQDLRDSAGDYFNSATAVTGEYALKFDGGAIVVGKDRTPLLLTQSQTGELTGNPFCRVFPICSQLPKVIVSSTQHNPYFKGIDLVAYASDTSGDAGALVGRRVYADYHEIAAKLDEGGHLYQLKGMAILSPQGGKEPLLATAGNNGEIVTFSFCRIFPFCSEMLQTK
jgi:hypothetical protein